MRSVDGPQWEISESAGPTSVAYALWARQLLALDGTTEFPYRLNAEPFADSSVAGSEWDQWWRAIGEQGWPLDWIAPPTRVLREVVAEHAEKIGGEITRWKEWFFQETVGAGRFAPYGSVVDALVQQTQLPSERFSSDVVVVPLDAEVVVALGDRTVLMSASVRLSPSLFEEGLAEALLEREQGQLRV